MDERINILAGLNETVATLTVDDAAKLVAQCEELKFRCYARLQESKNGGSTEALDVESVMARTGMSKGYLYREARKGRLPFARRIGRRVTFDAAGLDRWLARRTS